MRKLKFVCAIVHIIGVLLFILFGLGIEGISECELGAIIFYFIGAGAYGYVSAKILNKIIEV